MGAFYQTTPTNNIDFAYHLPKELMMAAIQNADSQNDALTQQLNLVNDEATKVQYLEPDRERVQQKAQEYKDQINQLAQQITKNPQDWRSQQSPIRNLSRQLSTDLGTGELSSIQGNYSKYQQWLKGETDRFNKGEITADWLNTAKAKYLQDFKGTNYDPTLGTANQIATQSLAKHVDLNKRFDDYLKEVKANAIEQKQAGMQGMYKITTDRGEEIVSQSRLTEIAADKLAADDEVKAYIKQGRQLGLTNPNSLVSAMKGAVGTYAYKKIKNTYDIGENPVAIHNDSEAQQNARQANSQTHEEAMIKLRDQLESARADEARKATQANADRAAKLKHNLDLNPNSVPESEINTPANSPKNPALGTSTSTLQMYDPNELHPDYLRTQVLPTLNSTLGDIDRRIGEAKTQGDINLANQLTAEKQSYVSQKNTAEGLINQAKQDYYKSLAYTGLSPKIQSMVKGYQDFLERHQLVDNPQARVAYGNSLGVAIGGTPNPIQQVGGEGGIQFRTNNQPYQGSGIPRKDIEDFNKAVSKAQTFLNEHTQKNEVGNQYNATGIDVNLEDPTITGLLNQAINSGNISLYQPNTTGGTTIEGKTRGLADYKTDDGNMIFGWNKEEPLTIQGLMKLTGAKTPTELFSKATVMPSTNGNLRVKVALKGEAPDGKTIGNSTTNYHQIEGLSESNEITFEVNGTNLNQQVISTLSKDPNPEVSKLSYIISDPDNANFYNKFIQAERPQASGSSAWGAPVEFGYGPAVYKITKAADGRVKAKVTIGNKSTEQIWNNDHEAEVDLIDLHTNLNRDYRSTINQMEKAGSLK